MRKLPHHTAVRPLAPPKSSPKGRTLKCGFFPLSLGEGLGVRCQLLHFSFELHQFLSGIPYQVEGPACYYYGTNDST